MGKSTDSGIVTQQKKDIIWEKLTVNDWSRVASIGHPEMHIETTETTLIMPCVYHQGDSSPSFHINTQKKIAKCFGAACGKFINDPIDLYARLSKKTYEDAAIEISATHSIPIFKASDTEKIKEQIIAERAMLHFHHIVTNELNKALLDPDNPEYAYALPALKYLKDIRKICIEINNYPIGIIPPEKVIQTYSFDPEEMYELSQLMNPIKDIKYIGQIVTTYRYSPDKIASFKIRSIRDLEGNLIESADRSKKSIFTLSHPKLKQSSNTPAFMGLEYYSHKLGATDSVVLVEGDFDFLSMATYQLEHECNQDIFLAIGGGSAGTDVSCLGSNFGLKYVYLLMDSPEARGDDLAYNIVRGSSGAISTGVYKWDDIKTQGKDPDDAIHLTDDFRALYKNFVTYKNYMTDEDFLCLRIKRILAKEEVTRNISTYEKIKIVASEIQKINDSVLAATTVNSVCTDIKIPKEEVMSILIPREENESVFREKFKQLFLKTFDVLGYTTNMYNSESDLLLWHNGSKAEFRVNSAKIREAQSMIAPYIGSLRGWIESTIGVPGFIRYMQTKDMPMERDDYAIEKILEQKLYTSIREMTKDKPQIHLEDSFKNGVFYLPDRENQGKKAWYIKNGNHIFKGTFTEIEGDIRWKRITKPVADGYHFSFKSNGDEKGESTKDTDKMPWSSFVTSEENMSKDRLNLQQMYDKVYKTLKHCYCFKHNIDYATASALSVYAPIYQLFDTKVFTHVTGESSSGKSSFVFGFLGGGYFRNFKVVEPFFQTANYSEAFIRQAVSGTRLVLCLDEFEDTGQNDEKSTVVRNILQLMRTANESGGVVSGRGTSGGDPKFYNINSPIIACSIRPMGEDADANRFMTLSTQKKDKFKNMNQLFSEVLSAEDRMELSASLSIDIYKYTQRFLDMHKELTRISKIDRFTDMMPQRTLGQLEVLASIIATCNNDVNAGIVYIKEWAKEKETEIHRIANVSHTKDLWEELLRREVFKTGNSKETDRLHSDYNINQILKRPDMREQLESKMIHGIKIYVSTARKSSERKFYLMISWSEAREIFSMGSEYKKWEPHKLKTAADRDMYVLSSEQIKREIPYFTSFLTENPNLNEVTVRDVTHIVKEANVPTMEQEVEKITATPSVTDFLEM